MPKSAFVDFKAVKSVLTMEQVLDHYHLLDKFKRTGDSLSGSCPIHKGSNPSQFRVSLSKNIWNCFSECKHGGNTLDFIARMESISIHAAALKAIEWFNLNLDDVAGKPDAEEEEPAEPTKKSPASKAKSDSQPVQKTNLKPIPENNTPNPPLKFRLEKLVCDHPYLAERGLEADTIIIFGIGFCSKGVLADRIAIPIHNMDGKIVAYAGRWPGEPAEDTPKYKLPQRFRKSLELFNCDQAFKESSDQPLVIVEGFFGCMHLYQCGYRKVVALMGSTMSEAQEALIRQNIERNSRIILMLDEDEAGRTGREEIAVRLSKLAFVTIHAFAQENMQPENLTADEVAELAN